MGLPSGKVGGEDKTKTKQKKRGGAAIEKCGQDPYRLFLAKVSLRILRTVCNWLFFHSLLFEKVYGKKNSPEHWLCRGTWDRSHGTVFMIFSFFLVQGSAAPKIASVCLSRPLILVAWFTHLRNCQAPALRLAGPRVCTYGVRRRVLWA